jgi:glycosyltransferase involved in cell wall biosynthesis
MMEFENELADKADILTMPNDHLARHFIKKHPRSQAKMRVLTNMHEREPKSSEAQPMIVGRPLVMTYAGRIYGLRDPSGLFRAMSMFIATHGVGSLRLDLVGVGKSRRLEMDIRRNGLSGAVRTLPFMDGEAFDNQLRASHLLVAINENIPGYGMSSPSKVYDYLATGTPILALTAAGATSDLLEETAAGKWIVPTDVEGIYQALEERLRMAPRMTANREKAMKYHARNVVAGFFDALSGYVSASPAHG